MAAKHKPTFFEYYQTLYPERFPELCRAFAHEQEYACFEEGLLQPYFLDPASVRVAEVLQPEGGSEILDLCAAPGGKTLVLAARMPETARLTANDRSAQRRGRLHKVLDDHLPGDIRKRVHVTGHDAAQWGLHRRDCYDRILLDAPCSSERHVFNSPPHLAQWSPARTKHLGIQAFAMLASAFDALAPGGRLVYATCSISPLENEEVVKKLIHRRKGSVLVDIEREHEEQADPGYRLWPDREHRWGPIYFAVITKT
ncbi:MAG: RsmB/NOP family class I SAM-dependent RNA methyltransferase [Spirochaetales bacterium]|nr:RsmB/NOP family class I SAM-dependent RNA methyltransferase [Spirochaetales bacterium]